MLTFSKWRPQIFLPEVKFATSHLKGSKHIKNSKLRKSGLIEMAKPKFPPPFLLSFSFSYSSFCLCTVIYHLAGDGGRETKVDLNVISKFRKLLIIWDKTRVQIQKYKDALEEIQFGHKIIMAKVTGCVPTGIFKVRVLDEETENFFFRISK